jgi:hypothetical protein
MLTRLEKLRVRRELDDEGLFLSLLEQITGRKLKGTSWLDLINDSEVPDEFDDGPPATPENIPF